MKKNRTKSSQHLELGFSLLEVLVALVVIAIGALGIAGLQANALKYSKNSELRALAVQASHDIFERMRINRAGAVNGEYASLATLSAVGTCVNPAPTDDVGLIINNVRCAMPGGRVSIAITPGATANNPAVVVVRVVWDETRLAGGQSQESYRVETQI